MKPRHAAVASERCHFDEHGQALPGHQGEPGPRYLLTRGDGELWMARSSPGNDISLFPAFLLAFRSLLMHQARIPACVSASETPGGCFVWEGVPGGWLRWAR